MSALSALRDGARRVARAPLLVVGVWLLNLLIAAPFAAAIRVELPPPWWDEFVAQVAALGLSLAPTVLGVAALVSGQAPDGNAALAALVSGAAAANLLIGAFLLGGVLDRLARDHATGSHGFFAACGGMFSRFLRLALITAPAYGVVAIWLYRELARNVLAGPLEVAPRALVPLALLLVIDLFVDYAQVRLVVEDRRSVIGAIAAAVRFVGRHAGATIGLLLVTAAVSGGVLALQAWLWRGAIGAGTALVLYLTIRLVTRLAFAAARIALFQSRLAHAGYTARPRVVWPDSPAAEAIRPD